MRNLFPFLNDTSQFITSRIRSRTNLYASSSSASNRSSDLIWKKVLYLFLPFLNDTSQFMKILAFMLFAIALSTKNLYADERIRIAGSSTVFPFMALASEEFVTKYNHKAPIIEVTGTGGGFKLFCSSLPSRPVIVMASRKIKASEIDACRKLGITDLEEIIIGYDGIVIAAANDSKYESFTKTELYKAMAHNFFENNDAIPNDFLYWSNLNSDFSHKKIEIYGPSSTSGTRDVLVDKIFSPFCKDKPASQCKRIRDDGAYIEMGENDNLIIQKISSNKNGIGVLGYSFIEKNRESIKPLSIDGIYPNIETILSGKYLLSRALYLYIDKDYAKNYGTLSLLIKEIKSEDAVGEYGYLTLRGLIPNPVLK